ncbi:hypothetical protein [Wolbachia endosymbiont (group A) of Pogonocherus hispidulus]|uniref:hypothetical protein n=1 Tax=Wolbachia endosymbiont (group A) of Pogonocherus hispidulus TaxID=3066136 RepID=UPI003340799B
MHNHYLHEKLAAFVIPARDAGIQKKRRMDPSVKHWDDTPLVGIAPKLQRSYSYGMNRGMT